MASATRPIGVERARAAIALGRIARIAFGPDRQRSTNGLQQPLAVAREVLRRAERAVHDGRQITRPELGDDRLGGVDGDGPLGRVDRPVEQDHDEPAFAREGVARHVRGDGVHPRRRRQHARRQIDGRKRQHGSRPIVFVDREVRRGQPAHRLAVAIEDRDLDINEIDAAAKRLLR